MSVFSAHFWLFNTLLASEGAIQGPSSFISILLMDHLRHYIFHQQTVGKINQFCSLLANLEITYWGRIISEFVKCWSYFLLTLISYLNVNACSYSRLSFKIFETKRVFECLCRQFIIFRKTQNCILIGQINTFFQLISLFYFPMTFSIPISL